MQGKVAYIRPKAVRPFPGTYASRSYMHQVALYCYKLYSLEIVKKAITLKRCTSCRYTKTTTRRQPLKRIKKTAILGWNLSHEIHHILHAIKNISCIN
jgi:hypothetical protein